MAEHNNKKLMMLMGILIIVIILFGGLSLYESRKQNSQEGSNTNQKSAEQYTIQHETPASKIIFSNNLYQYRIVLPNDWTVSQSDALEIDDVSFYDPVAQAQEQKATDLGQGMKLEISVVAIQPELSLEQYVNEIHDKQYIVSRRDFTLDQNPAIEVVDNLFGHEIATYVRKNNLVFSITGSIADTQVDRYVNIYYDIIATFTFINVHH